MQSLNLAVVVFLIGAIFWLWQIFGPGSKMRQAFSQLPRVEGVFLVGNLKEMIGFYNYKHTFQALQKTGYICGLRVASLRVRLFCAKLGCAQSCLSRWGDPCLVLTIGMLAAVCSSR